jgi:hypothetical protein
MPTAIRQIHLVEDSDDNGINFRYELLYDSRKSEVRLECRNLENGAGIAIPLQPNAAILAYLYPAETVQSAVEMRAYRPI